MWEQRIGKYFFPFTKPLDTNKHLTLTIKMYCAWSWASILPNTFGFEGTENEKKEKKEIK